MDRIILREKDLSIEELLIAAEKIKCITEENNISLIINGNMEVAQKINAEGFHIGFKKFMEEKYDYSGLIGVSVHSLEEAILAEKNGADYILASHIFQTNCKKGLEPKGIKFIENIKSKVNIPVIALGGINEKNAKEVIVSGADGIAVMSYIMAAQNPYEVSRILKEEMVNADKREERKDDYDFFSEKKGGVGL